MCQEKFFHINVYKTVILYFVKLLLLWQFLVCFFDSNCRYYD